MQLLIINGIDLVCSSVCGFVQRSSAASVDIMAPGLFLGFFVFFKEYLFPEFCLDFYYFLKLNKKFWQSLISTYMKTRWERYVVVIFISV